MMQFTDSHCHLDDQAFAEQLPQLLAQCDELAIKRIIIPAISPNNFDNVLNLVEQYHNKPIKLYPCLGIHPWFLDELNDSHLTQLANKVSQVKESIIAIGEIGIDGANIKRSENPEAELKKQQHFFDVQLSLAKQQHLPVIIHHRQSHDKIMPFLRKYQLPQAGIIHGFSGSYQQAIDYINLGFKLGVGSTISFSRAKKTINAIKRLPIDSLVLETDAPSMPLSKEVLTNKTKDYLKSNTVNSPTALVTVFELLSKIRSENAIDIATQLELNIEQVFFQ